LLENSYADINLQAHNDIINKASTQENASDVQLPNVAVVQEISTTVVIKFVALA